MFQTVVYRKGPRFESRRGTNFFFGKTLIYIILPNSAQVRLMGNWHELIP